jgi:hypothetical protein
LPTEGTKLPNKEILPSGVSVGCKWTFNPEEVDLPPIAADTTAGYTAGGGVHDDMLENVRSEVGLHP